MHVVVRGNNKQQRHEVRTEQMDLNREGRSTSARDAIAMRHASFVGQ